MKFKIILLSLLFPVFINAQSPGDTIVIPSYNYSQTSSPNGRDTMILFPDDPGVVLDVGRRRLQVDDGGEVGGAARVILEEAGVHDVLCKSLGSANHINVARATVAGLKSLQRPDEIAARRGLPAEEFVPKGLLNAYNERQKARAGAATTGSAQ